MTFDHGRCLLGIVGSSSHSICLSVSIRPFLSPATPQMGIWYLHALPLLSPASLAADLEQACTPTSRGARCPPSLETCLLTEEQRKSIRRTQPIQQSLCHAALCSLGLDVWIAAAAGVPARRRRNYEQIRDVIEPSKISVFVLKPPK